LSLVIWDLPSNRYAEISERITALRDKYDLPYTTGSLGHQYMQTFWTILKLSLPNKLLEASGDDAPETHSELKFRIRAGVRDSFGIDPGTVNASRTADSVTRAGERGRRDSVSSRDMGTHPIQSALGRPSRLGGGRRWSGASNLMAPRRCRGSRSGCSPAEIPT
jgi:hypothetical protein